MGVCPVTLLRNEGDFASDKEGEGSEPLVILEAAHIITFSIGNADVHRVLHNMYSGS